MTASWWVAAIVCCGFYLLAVWWGSSLFRAESDGTENGRLPLILAAALVVRLALAATTKGHPADIGTFGAWAGHAAEGLTSFYSPGYFADYPPGYIYILWLVGKLRLLFGLQFDAPGFLTLLKLPAIISDLVAVWLLYRLATKRWGNFAAAVLAGLYAFNPAVIFDSAVWGQVDGVLTLFILLGVLLLENTPAGSAAAFAVALLIKPQALIFAPLPIFFFADRLFHRRDGAALSDLLVFCGAGILVFILGVFPFAAGEGPAWIAGKYGTTLASYPYATLNAFNLYALIGANTASAADKFLFFTYSAWGTIFICLIVLFSALIAFRGKDSSRLWYIALFLGTSVFVLSAKMHERYLFPALALALGFYIVSRDQRGLWLFAGFSVTQFLNMAVVLALSLHETYAVPRLDPLLLVVSLANVLLWIVLVRVGSKRYLSPHATME